MAFFVTLIAMFEGKLSSSLLQQLQSNNDPNIDVVIELKNDADGLRVASLNIPAMQQNFNRVIQPVTEAIENGGGNVLGTAWINQTLKARIPKSCLSRLASLSAVSAIDVPHKISR